MNTFGNAFRLTTFGESHGPAMGGVIDGMPPQVKIDLVKLQQTIDRRRTGVDPLTSQRRESDVPEILSGLSADAVTLGTPIGFIFRNTDARSGDYNEIEHRFRPNHADYTYIQRYGLRDPRGGGRASARETLCRVMGGAFAMQWLQSLGISFSAKVTAVGSAGYDDILLKMALDADKATLPDIDHIEEQMRAEVARAKHDLDSVGGRVTCLISGLPAGIGTPVFDKLHARLASAVMSINAAKSFEYGLGALSASKRGSETLDLFCNGFAPCTTRTNFSGGIQGGISNGMPIFFNVSFKPTPTISRPLPMPDDEGHNNLVSVRGRHDPCVALRAPVIVESMAALTLADLILSQQSNLLYL